MSDFDDYQQTMSDLGGDVHVPLPPPTAQEKVVLAWRDQPSPEVYDEDWERALEVCSHA